MTTRLFTKHADAMLFQARVQRYLAGVTAIPSERLEEEQGPVR